MITKPNRIQLVYKSLRAIVLAVLFWLPLGACGADDPISVPAPDLSVKPAVVDFGSALTSVELNISNDGGEQLSWTVETAGGDWLTAAPLTGSNAGTVTVTADRSGMTSGAYEGTVTVSSNGGTKTIDVDMVVPDPVLRLPVTALDFGRNTTSNTFDIENTGGGTMTWSVSEDQPWITVTPGAGQGPATITVEVERDGLDNGVYSDTVSVESNGGNGKVAVDMTVLVTKLVFRGSSLSRTLDVYATGPGVSGKIGTLATPAWQVEKEVQAGTYSYYFVDPGCGLQTTTKSTTVAQDQVKLLTVFSSGLNFQRPILKGLSVTEGSYEDRVRVSWSGVSPAPSYYEIQRALPAGTWAGLTTTTSNSYDDRSVPAITSYWYRVRPVWACATGSWVQSTVTGYTKSASFTDATITWDNTADWVKLHADLSVWGMKNQKKGISSYWLRNQSSWVCSGCNVPVKLSCISCSNGVLLHSSDLTPTYDKSSWSGITHTYPYGCFTSKTGRYWSRFSFYKSTAASCTGSTYARSAWFWFDWTASADGTSGRVVAAGVLTEEESRLRDEAIARSGGIRAPSEVVDCADCSGLRSTAHSGAEDRIGGESQPERE